MKKTSTITLIVIAVVVALIIIRNYSHKTVPPVSQTPQPIATVSYMCNAGKTITAVYYKGESTPAPSPGQPPTPGGSVALTLSDGRSMTLKQSISADGARYASENEAFVFWSKGNGALVLENNEQKSYIGCIALAPQPIGSTLSQGYANSEEGFSLRLPTDYGKGVAYTYEELGPGKGIYGIKFAVPASLAADTNLSSDSYISVEQIPQTTTCSAALFLEPGATVSTVAEGDTTYSKGSSSGAGAGNRYNETIYALPGTNPCIAVRYFIHYAVFENYPPGTVKKFDEQALLNQFDAIRHTLTIVQ